MRVVTICLPDTYVAGMDKLIAKEMYPNRSEVIRIAIRDLLVEELWGQKREAQGIPLVTQIEKVTSLQSRTVSD
jgi:metal-responsive CopG/Arc/MetJ family transcriptional regulator